MGPEEGHGGEGQMEGSAAEERRDGGVRHGGEGQMEIGGVSCGGEERWGCDVDSWWRVKA